MLNLAKLALIRQSLLIRGNVINSIYILVVLLSISQALAESITYGSHCSTPQNEQGKCMPVESCANKVATPHIQSHACGTINAVQHICCPINAIQLNTLGLELLKHESCQVHNKAEIKDASSLPWTVSLKSENEETQLCGGTLINNRYVLTTAHCVTNDRFPIDSVQLGMYDKVNMESVKNIKIEQILVHPNYTRPNRLPSFGDIALLRLSNTVEFSKNIQPICLPITKELMTEHIDKFFVGGFGFAADCKNTDAIQFVTLNNLPMKKCDEAYHKNFLEDMLCIGVDDPNGICGFVSGSSLFQFTNNSPDLRVVQHGILAYGLHRGNFRDIYINVAKHMQWITDAIKN